MSKATKWTILFGSENWNTERKDTSFASFPRGKAAKVKSELHRYADIPFIAIEIDRDSKEEEEDKPPSSLSEWETVWVAGSRREELLLLLWFWSREPKNRYVSDPENTNQQPQRPKPPPPPKAARHLHLVGDPAEEAIERRRVQNERADEIEAEILRKREESEALEAEREAKREQARRDREAAESARKADEAAKRQAALEAKAKREAEIAAARKRSEELRAEMAAAAKQKAPSPEEIQVDRAKASPLRIGWEYSPVELSEREKAVMEENYRQAIKKGQIAAPESLAAPANSDASPSDSYLNLIGNK